MSLHLLSDLLDSHDATETVIRDFTTRYEIALSTGDELDVRRVKAAAAVYELHNPGVRVLDELDAIQNAAA
ncbi:hypothetical protein [Streptomyces sp. NPDC050428]|uniref:hypothetical protein n=1 Tax=Streptomyces sp. NPDC050428 TaxID=3155757 RepID=UPI0034480FB7